MALQAQNTQHLKQILAGTEGRKKGHEFEINLANKINRMEFSKIIASKHYSHTEHIFLGNPSDILVSYVISRETEINELIGLHAIATGAIATAERDLKTEIFLNGKKVSRTKSDIILELEFENQRSRHVGISIKQCNNEKPTNAQLYFTTANGFSELLKRNQIDVPDNATSALRQFCGDTGFRPLDASLKNRQSDPRRYFWEEIDESGRLFWEELFRESQWDVTNILLKKAYLDDPVEPDYLIHKTKKIQSPKPDEFAVFSINELIDKSISYKGFEKKDYRVSKGKYKDPENISHHAPRFGIVQMQRGGQKQHPSQLQFNLEAGYFYKI